MITKLWNFLRKWFDPAYEGYPQLEPWGEYKKRAEAGFSYNDKRLKWKPLKKKGHYDLHIKEIKGTKI